MSACMKNEFKLPRELGEASLIKVARKAHIEGVWLYQEGVFRDISEAQSPTTATFVVRISKRLPFTVYHIHPAHVSARGGYIDTIKDYKISPPSIEDLNSYVHLREKFSDLLTCKVADGWGVWTYALTPAALRDDLVERLNDKIIATTIYRAYRDHRYFTLRPSFDEREAFRRKLKEFGLLLRYETIYDLYGKAIPQ